MSTANNKIQITELDFDLIKENLISFMKGQTVFSDYNFLGSGLQVLIDELAYNTHYSAYFVNMVANEMFISTAIVRDNIVKLAKMLNYVPVSSTSPSAFVNITITPPTSNVNSTLLLPRFTSFISTAIDGVNYNFVTSSSHIAQLNNGVFQYDAVEIKEGDVVSVNYTVDTVTNPRNTFLLDNANVDTKTLIVNVTRNNLHPPVTNTFILSADVSLLDGNSEVFFVEPTDDSKYEIYFGDGVLGRTLVTGDVVNTNYLVNHGPLANYANNFTIMSPIGSFSNVIVESVVAADGGSEQESNDSIKRNAPHAYSTQERAVTLQDYQFLISRDFGNVGSLSLWSGDKNDPPVYGKVFISIKPKFGNYLTVIEKNAVLNLLSKYNMPTVTPNIVDPDYTYLLLNVKVNYDPSKTSTPNEQLIANIRNTIISYGQNQLSKFDTTYRESILANLIYGVDNSILGISSSIYLQKRFLPIIGSSTTYTLKYNVPLLRGGLLDKLYTSPGIFIYDSSGNQRTCFIEENINTYQGITSIEISDPGYNYTGIPTITINGDGFGATAHAVVVNGSIQKIIIDTQGEGYSVASINITGGGGYGAIANPILSSSSGILKTYYIDSANKYYITENQGTVDHVNGIITINDLNTLGLENDSAILAVNIKPNDPFILPKRNNILLIDSYDPKAIQITLIPQIST